MITSFARRCRPTVLSISLICSLLLTSSAFSEDPRGRLADGRAFRTDSEGNKLVDYIAELELNIDALNRRALGLEDQLNEKQAVIDRLSTRDGAGSAVQERSVSDTSATTVAVPCPVVNCPSRDCSSEIRSAEASWRSSQDTVNDQLAGQRQECVEEVSRLQASLSSLRGDLRTKEAQLRDYQAGMARAASDSQRAGDALSLKNAELASLRGELAASDREGISLQSEIDERRAGVDKLRMQLSSLDGEIQKLQTRLDDSKVRRVALEVQNAAYDKIIAENEREMGLRAAKAQEHTSVSSSVMAALPSESYRDAPAPSAPAALLRSRSEESPRASLGLSRMHALDSLRGSLATGVNQIQSLLVARDKLYQEYVTTPHVVNFRPSAAVSSRGTSLSTIRARIQSAETGRELSLLTRDVSEIRSRIEGDIALMKRVRKLS